MTSDFGGQGVALRTCKPSKFPVEVDELEHILPVSPPTPPLIIADEVLRGPGNGLRQICFARVQDRSGSSGGGGLISQEVFQSR